MRVDQKVNMSLKYTSLSIVLSVDVNKDNEWATYWASNQTKKKKKKLVVVVLVIYCSSISSN